EVGSRVLDLVEEAGEDIADADAPEARVASPAHRGRAYAVEGHVIGDRVGPEDAEHAAHLEGADAVAEEDVALAKRGALALEVGGLGEAVAAEDARRDLAGAAQGPAVLHRRGRDAEVADAQTVLDPQTAAHARR